MNITVLGSGLVGSAMARDMADHGHRVSVYDADPNAFRRLPSEGIHRETADLSRPESIQRVVESADLVIGALPGFMGLNSVRAVIEAGRNIVDISFFPEDPFQLEELADKHGVTAFVDCGVAPGFSHIAFGHMDRQFDETRSLTCYVGGLPQVRRQPFEYGIVFSFRDVIEEYTRPARLVKGGEVVVREALSDLEAIDFPGVGTLEAFNTDGLRSLIRTIRAPQMTEKTLRYPGHVEKMKLLRDLGFFSSDHVQVGNQQVRPVDVSAGILEPQLQLPEGESDLTVMRIEGHGVNDGDSRIIRYDLLDRYDPQSGITSMARTTGYTATSISSLFLDGKIELTGLVLPEYLGRVDGFMELLLQQLADRGVHYRVTE